MRSETHTAAHFQVYPLHAHMHVYANRHEYAHDSSKAETLHVPFSKHPVVMGKIHKFTQPHTQCQLNNK